MTCHECNGEGEVLLDDGSQNRCGICYGSGELCDVCGEASEPGQNVHLNCEEDL